MELSPDQVDLVTRIVRQILAERAGEVAETSVDDGVHPDVEAAVRAARQGFEDYRGCSVEDRRRFIGAIRRFCTNEYFLSYMCEQTVRETRMGNAKDKYLKNLHAARHTPGVEDICTRAWSGDEGLTTVEYSPYGVIGAICPTTNPTATIINNAIGMLAAGNTVVFAPHPRAQGISIWLVRKLNAELAKAGAPKNLLVTLADPSQQATGALMEHPGVDLLVVTGGRSIVQRGLRSGKKPSEPDPAIPRWWSTRPPISPMPPDASWPDRPSTTTWHASRRRRSSRLIPSPIC